MNLLEKLVAYQPVNEQEQRDKQVMLQYIKEHTDFLERSSLIAHFTASAWTLNQEHTKTLMVYHNLYDSWSWIGGHADGMEDLSQVAMKELQEETGVNNAKLLSENIFSIEILTADGHMKRGKYVPSHLHMNVTFLAEADERETLTVNTEENRDVRWCTFEEALTLPKEPWMVENVYRKLMEASVRK